MLRNIIFRGKRIDNGEWVYGGITAWKDGYSSAITTLDENEFDSMALVYPETIGQYTGLTDKNGTKIFEGDILCTNSTVLSKLIVHWFERCGGFFLSDNKDIEASSLTPIYSVNLYKYVVIGNIYDNPELLD